MRIFGIICLIFVTSLVFARALSETGMPGAEAIKANEAAFAFARSVATEGTPEFTTALRKALALANGIPISEEAMRSLSLLVSTRGSLDLDERYRRNFIDPQQRTVRIWGGEPVPPGLHLDTVAISGKGGICTGTLISPKAVLTAAHCYCDGVSEKIYVGQAISSATNTIAVSSGKALIKCTQELKDGDLAVLMLQTAATVPPRSLAGDMLINSAKHGRAVGFGNTANPRSEPLGIKRRVDLPVASADCNGNVGSVADSTYYGCAAGRELVAGAPSLDKDTCSGDSGGPLFVESRDGNLYLAATTSRPTGHPGLRPCGDGSVFVRTDSRVIAWIQSLGVEPRVGPSE